MKSMYGCEKCGKVFDNWRDCQRCEENHATDLGTETWIEQNFAYGEGKTFPTEVVLASKTYEYTIDGTRTIYSYARYKLSRELKGDEHEDIESARIAEEERAEREWAEYKARTERKEKKEAV